MAQLHECMSNPTATQQLRRESGVNRLKGLWQPAPAVLWQADFLVKTKSVSLHVISFCSFVYSWEPMKESGQGEGEAQTEKLSKKLFSERLVNRVWQQRGSAAPHMTTTTLPSHSLPSFSHIYELFSRLLSKAWWERYYWSLRAEVSLNTSPDLIVHLCVYCVVLQYTCKHLYASGCARLVYCIIMSINVYGHTASEALSPCMHTV